MDVNIAVCATLGTDERLEARLQGIAPPAFCAELDNPIGVGLEARHLAIEEDEGCFRDRIIPGAARRRLLAGGGSPALRSSPSFALHFACLLTYWYQLLFGRIAATSGFMKSGSIIASWLNSPAPASHPPPSI